MWMRRSALRCVYVYNACYRYWLYYSRIREEDSSSPRDGFDRLLNNRIMSEIVPNGEHVLTILRIAVVSQPTKEMISLQQKLKSHVRCSFTHKIVTIDISRRNQISLAWLSAEYESSIGARGATV